MGPVRAEVAIDIPRDSAFDFLVDLANRPAFTDHFTSDFHLTRLDSVGLGAGARFRVSYWPGSFWMETVIEVVERPNRILERGRGGRNNRIPVTTAWELLEGPGALITVRTTFWSEPGHPVDRVRELVGAASFHYSRNLATGLRRLREVLESDAARPRRAAVAGGDRVATALP